MKYWVCKSCGLYQKENFIGIEAGRRVYFYKGSNNFTQIFSKINNKDVNKGVVLKNYVDYLVVLCGGKIIKVKGGDVFLDDPNFNFLYNMFGACEC